MPESESLFAACALHGQARTIGCPGCDEAWEDHDIAALIRQRDAEDTGERITLDDLHAQGIEEGWPDD